MGKQTKKQKRNKKLQARKNQQFQFMNRPVRVDGRNLAIRMPNEQKRVAYIQALFDDFDKRIGD